VKKLYVGNLPFSVNDAELHEMFEQHGQVSSASVVIHRDTGRSRGFGFVEMPDDGEAERAISAMHGAEIGGRPLVVNEAQPREARPGGFGGDRGRGGRGGGRERDRDRGSW